MPFHAFIILLIIRTANSPLVKSIDFCGQWRPTEMSLSGNILLKREEAVAKGINFDRIVAELIMKMNRMQVNIRVQPTNQLMNSLAP